MTTIVDPKAIAASIVLIDADADGNEDQLRAILAPVTSDAELELVLEEIARLRGRKHVLGAVGSGFKTVGRGVAKVGDRDAVLGVLATVGSGTKTGLVWPFKRAALAHRRHQAKVQILDERLSHTK